MPDSKKLCDLRDTWQKRIYNEDCPSDPKTLFAQLARIATHRAVYVSLIEMTKESQVDRGAVMIDCLRDGYYADLVMTTRRLLESNNFKKNGEFQKEDRAVISLYSFAQELSRSHVDECLLKKLETIKEKAGETPDKIFHHSDYLYQSGKKELTLATESDFDDVIIGLKKVLLEGCSILNINVPDKLIPTNQFDWSEAFSQPWKSEDFDDSEIWDDERF